MEIVNAKIVKTKLGLESEIGVYSWGITLETPEFHAMYGGYRIDCRDEKTGGIQGDRLGLTSIIKLLEALEIDTWEELKGAYVRVQLETDYLHGCKLIAVGHLMKNKWFNISEFYEKNQNV